MFSIPFLVFLVLLVAGLWLGELGFKGILVFLGIWVLAVVSINTFAIPPMVRIIVEVLLDIVLILKIFGADLQIR